MAEKSFTLPLSSHEDSILCAAIEGNQENVVNLVLGATLPETRQGYIERSLLQAGGFCSYATLEIFGQFGFDVNCLITPPNSAHKRLTLLEVLLNGDSLFAAGHLLEIGCTIDFTEISRDSSLVSSVREFELMLKLLDKVKEPQLRQKFVNALLFELIQNPPAETNFNDSQEAEHEIHTTAKFLIQQGASPFFKWPDSDYLFHEAARFNNLTVVTLLLEAHPSTNFDFEGGNGKTPIRYAAESHYCTQSDGNIDPAKVAVLNLLLSRLGERERSNRVIQELINTFESLSVVAAKKLKNMVPIDEPFEFTRLDAVKSALLANNLQSIEFHCDVFGETETGFLSRRQLVDGIKDFHFSSSMQYLIMRLSPEFFGPPYIPFSERTKPDDILSAIALLVEQNLDLRTKVFVLCQNSALSLPIGKDILALSDAFLYIKPAIVSSVHPHTEIARQFANFVAHSLPSMPARNAFLLENYTKLGSDLAYRGTLTKSMLDQLQALHVAGEQAHVKLRKNLLKALPRIAGECVDRENGLLKVYKLEEKLQEFGLFRQNALRVIHVLEIAYSALTRRDTSSIQSSNIQQAHWQVQRQFATQLNEEFAATLAAVMDARNDQPGVRAAAHLAQKEFSMAARSLDQPDYMHAQGRETIDNAFCAMAGETFMELLWWQMDQVCQAFALRLPGQEKWEHGKLMPFLVFQNRLETDVTFQY